MKEQEQGHQERIEGMEDQHESSETQDEHCWIRCDCESRAWSEEQDSSLPAMCFDSKCESGLEEKKREKEQLEGAFWTGREKRTKSFRSLTSCGKTMREGEVLGEMSGNESPRVEKEFLLDLRTRKKEKERPSGVVDDHPLSLVL